MTSPVTPAEFIDRWKDSAASERANLQTFVNELCALLDVNPPDPSSAVDSDNRYAFERVVTFRHADGSTSTGFVDLYKRGHFVLEGKQGADPQQQTLFPKKRKTGTALRGTATWDSAMERAKNQGERYIRALDPSEGRPPFLIVIDVAYSFEIYAEFSRTGGEYLPFPDPQSHRFYLDELDDERLKLLRAVWLEPLTLDPTRRSAKVTRDIAAKLAKLARSLESLKNDQGERRHSPEQVAGFLMRCIFTMFAEDVGLLPKRGFQTLLESRRDNLGTFAPMLQSLWQTMDSGGFSAALDAHLLHFNGGLFADADALPVSRDQLELLIQAAHADWREVEPAIFGTLLERALSPAERHKLGAHYTPRDYVERLVIPTVIDPLRDRWRTVKALMKRDLDRGNSEDATAALRTFHAELCNLRVLDPACGSGNFLYVSLELLKRLEGEVLDALQQLGEQQGSFDMPAATVDPHQFLGLEVNPRAAKIAELVLWIGYLQWHVRTRGNLTPPEPVLRDFRNIVCQDAVLAYDGTRPKLGDDNEPITRWDGKTFKPHPTTGEDVPDESARVVELEYLNPHRTTWPPADFIIGNPPFIGKGERMREALGDGYTKALRETHDDVPESADFVMYWWNHAAHLAREGHVERFGFITTNSLRQTFNRRVVQKHLAAKDNPLSLVFAIPDHPWVDASDGAAVRIAMTTAEAGEHIGTLQRVVSEEKKDALEAEVELSEKVGIIYADLTIGADVAGCAPLKANGGISSNGAMLAGAEFIITPKEAEKLGLGSVEGLEQHIRPYRSGRDLTQNSRDAMVIDLYGLDAEAVRKRYPEVYQHVYEYVKPKRDQNNRKSYRENWWIFAEARAALRSALEDTSRYIATVETSKHRFFTFLDTSILPDHMLVSFALEDAYFLGVLSSRVHTTWVTANAASLGVFIGNVRYTKTRCFEPFPFPLASDEQRRTIRDIAESLDQHRKTQQSKHDGLTLTGMYNVLEKRRQGETLTAKEKEIHEQGLVAILQELHDELDEAVLAAYGWPTTTSDEDVLMELVALNAERAAEERRGVVRWLRPDYQDPDGTTQQQLVEVDTVTPVAAKDRASFPKELPRQVEVLRQMLAKIGRPVTSEELAQSFKGARRDKVRDLLAVLVSLGQVQEDGGRFLG